MSIKNKITPFLLGMLLLASCKPQQKSNKVIDVLQTITGPLDASTKAIVVVDDNNCLGCNQAFAAFIAKYKVDRNIKFIISADANKVDISEFLSPADNIYMDSTRSLYNGKFIKASTLFVLKDKRIDTFISITPQNAESLKEFTDSIFSK